VNYDITSGISGVTISGPAVLTSPFPGYGTENRSY
jgi:hypothetical protein